LRRAEVAALVGVSVEYYSRLERGALGGVSPSVLGGLARALQLDDAERAHLLALAQTASGTGLVARPRRRPTARWTPRPSLQRTLDSITAPAIVVNGRMDLLAANTLGRAMYSSVHESVHAAPAGAPPNFARYTFLDPDGRRFYPHWDAAAAVCVSILRTTAGRDDHDKEMHDLVGELSTRSEEFRRLWGAHDVRHHGAGTKTFHHDEVGDLELAFESTALVAEPGLTLTVYTAEPAGLTADRLQVLAAWAATDWAGSGPAAPSPTGSSPTALSRQER
jgi:transcriptional regulator with XRE-family HTH domain